MSFDVNLRIIAFTKTRNDNSSHDLESGGRRLCRSKNDAWHITKIIDCRDDWSRDSCDDSGRSKYSRCPLVRRGLGRRRVAWRVGGGGGWVGWRLGRLARRMGLGRCCTWNRSAYWSGCCCTLLRRLLRIRPLRLRLWIRPILCSLRRSLWVRRRLFHQRALGLGRLRPPRLEARARLPLINASPRMSA